MAQFEFIKFNQDAHSEIWEEINLNSDSTFLTSLKWISFQKFLGKEIDQYLIKNNNEFVGLIYIEISRRKIAKYAYVPYGPVLSSKFEVQSSNFSELLSDLRIFGKKYCDLNNINLFKIDPMWDRSQSELLKKSGWRKSFSPGQAMDTWIMDISGNEEEILKMQKKDTRYYLKYAGKKGVVVRIAETENDIKKFGDLMKETMERNNFVNYPTNYFLKQWENLNSKEGKSMCEIWLAELDGVAISGALMNYYKDSIYYSHGASTSDSKYTKLASPYFLHWNIIKDAKSRGIKNYNFWGVLPDSIKDHPWSGLSDFKKKFSGEMRNFVGTYEVYSNPYKYFVNRIFDWWAFRKDRYWK